MIHLYARIEHAGDHIEKLNFSLHLHARPRGWHKPHIDFVLALGTYRAILVSVHRRENAFIVSSSRREVLVCYIFLSICRKVAFVIFPF